LSSARGLFDTGPFMEELPPPHPAPSKEIRRAGASRRLTIGVLGSEE